MSRRREIVFGLTVSLLMALGFWYLVFRTSGFAKDAAEDKRLQIDQLAAESSTSPQTINVLGHTTVPARVRLLLNRNPNAYSDWRDTLGDGSFSFEEVIVEPRDSNIKIEARTTIGSRALETKREINVWLTPTVVYGTVLDSNGSPPKQTKLWLVSHSAERLSWSTSISDGKFVIPDLAPGGYKLTIWAPQSALYQSDVNLSVGKSLDVGEVRLASGDSPAPVISADQPITRRDFYQILAFDPNKFPKPIARTITADVSYRELVMSLDATLRFDDKRVGILQGKASLIPRESRESQFIKQVFNDFLIQDHTLDEFDWKFDEPKCEKGLCPIHATSEPAHIEFSRTLNQEWTIRTDWNRPKTDTDSFVLKVRDYQIEGADTPDVSSAAAKWTNEGKDDPFKFKLAYSLSSPVNLLRVFTSPVEELAPRAVTPLIQFLFGCLVAIPLLWTLWFFKKFHHLERVTRHFTPAAKWLLLCGIAIAFFPAFYYAVQSTSSYLTVRRDKPVPNLSRALMHLVDSRILSDGNDLRLWVIASCLVGVAVILLLVIGHVLLLLQGKRAIAVWGTAILKGIAIAGFINLVLTVFIGLGQRFLGRSPIGVAQLLPWMFNLSVLALLILLSLRTLRYFNERWVSKQLIALLAVVAILLSYPAYAFNVINTPVAAVLQLTVRYRVQEFFGLIQGLVPYLALGLLLPLLQQEELYRDSGLVSGTPAAKNTRRIALGLGLILFAAYLVGTTSTWLFFPIPFFVALYLFRRYVLKKTKSHIVLDRVTNEVIERRAELLKIHQSLDEQPPTAEAIERSAGRGIPLREAVLGIGPFSTNWANGVWAIKRGLIVALPLLIIDLGQYLGQFKAASGFPFLRLGRFMFRDVAYWAVAGFFFGYFFKYLSKSSGVRKGLHLAIVISLCLAASDMISNLREFLGRVTQFVYFFSLLGFWAFDYKTFRGAQKEDFTWKSFYRYENLTVVNSAHSIWKTAMSGIALLAVSRMISVFLSYFIVPSFPELAKILTG